MVYNPPCEELLTQCSPGEDLTRGQVKRPFTVWAVLITSLRRPTWRQGDRMN
jgi:hypothetical protein